MTATLLIPAGDQPPFQVRFRLVRDHPLSQHGHGVLLDRGGSILDGTTFRRLRECIGAELVASDPFEVCRALKVLPDEPGIRTDEN